MENKGECGLLLAREFSQTQIKHTKNSSIKNFGAPKKNPPPPAEILFVWDFSCILKGKEAPNIKNLGLRDPWKGGSGRDVLGEVLYVSAIFGGLI